MILCVLIFSSFLTYTNGTRLVCYYTNWAKYRNGKGKFLPESINPSICTHIIYAYAVIRNLKIVPMYPDEAWREGLYSRVIKAKNTNPNLRVLLSVGGDAARIVDFKKASQSDENRNVLANQTVAFLRERGFDGIEVSWTPPSAGYKILFRSLIEAFRHAFDEDAKNSGRARLLLSAAMSSSKKCIEAGYGDQLQMTSLSMDFMTLKTFDFHGTWDAFTGVQAPLYAHPHETGEAAYLNLDWVAKFYVSKGVDKQLINIGISTYAASFHLKNPDYHWIGSEVTGPGDPGKYTGKRGLLAYFEVCTFIFSGADVFNVPSQKVRYAVKGYQWIGIDDIDSVKAKTCYALKSGFGGVSVWSLDLDDFSGICGQGRYPLIKAIYKVMNGSVPCLMSSVLDPLVALSGVNTLVQRIDHLRLLISLLWSVIGFNR